MTHYHHVLNPATGCPSETEVASITVIARSSTSADALSTTAFVLGLEKGKALIESIGGIQAVFIDMKRNFHDSLTIGIPSSLLA